MNTAEWQTNERTSGREFFAGTTERWRDRCERFPRPSISLNKEPAPKTRPVDVRFQELKRAWKVETAYLSSLTELGMNPNYQRIIGLGPDVVPILLRELAEAPDHWFWALEAITGTNPVPPEDCGRLRRMAHAWLAWGKEKGLYWP